MPETKCPICGSNEFHVKNPDDVFDVCQFECRDGRIVFAPDLEPAEIPEICNETIAYCNRCAWHDRFDRLDNR